MGADTFTVRATGRNAKEAFRNATEKARYDFGHAGYTGTIAEKHEFTMIDLPPGKKPEEYAEELINNADPRIDDKWGPAGCIDCGQLQGVKEDLRTYLFFGWASS